MSFAQKSGGDGSEGGETGINLLGEGKAKVIGLEWGQEGAAGDGSAVGPTEQSFRALISGLKGDRTERMELISKWEASRTQAAEEERRIRRAVWTEETRKVILERQLFRERGTTDVFPELVWKQILKNLDDAKDNARLAGMSLLWRDLLKKDRTTFIFNEVFALLHAKGYLPRKEILLLRSVSREWRNSADNWLQNFIEHPNQSYLQLRKFWQLTGHDKIDKVSVSIPMDTGRRLSMLASLGSLHDGNPFLSRMVELGSVEPHDYQHNLAYWTAAEGFMARWGQQVWTVKVQFSRPNHFDCLRAYVQIVRLLRLLPNLRELVLLSPNSMVPTLRIQFVIPGMHAG